MVEADFGSAVAPGKLEVIHTRVARMMPAACQLLAAASVLGQRSTFHHLWQVVGTLRLSQRR